jgi:hypothetical protein
MNVPAISPKDLLVKLDKSDLTESTNCVHSWYGVGVNACIHGTVLMRFGMLLV